MKHINKFIISFLLFLPIILFSVSDLQCRDGAITPVVPHVLSNPTLLLVGTFYPAGTRPRGNVIAVKIHEKKFYFKIKSARNLYGSELAYTIISNLFPPELRLAGPDKIIDPLLKKNIFGKLYSLRGTVYASDNLMYLDKVTEGNLFDEKSKGK